jgi:hypothetical protein
MDVHEGPPVGRQIVGRSFTDPTMLCAAHIQKRLPFGSKRPDL